MPILDIEIVVDESQQLDDALAGELANAAGEVMQTPPGTTWVRLRTLARNLYAESGGGPPDSVLPVFVTILKSRPPHGDVLKEEIERMTQRIAQICRRPADNVHVLYLPEAAGRIAFGGVLRE